MPDDLSIDRAKAQFSEVLELMRKSVQGTSQKHLEEAARCIARNPPGKGEKILARLYRMRHAKSVSDFNAYTTKPCGCYDDPGGHP